MMSLSSSEKEDFWRLAVDEWRSCGLSVKAFCEREGLAQPSFYAWRKKIQRQDGDREKLRSGRAEKSPAPGFLPVKVIDERSRVVADDCYERIEITTPGGLRLRCEGGLPSERLQALLASMLQAESGVLPAEGSARC